MTTRLTITVGALIAVAFLLASAFLACGSGELTLDQVDPNAVPQNPSFDQVNAIIQRNCVSCHDGDSDSGSGGLFGVKPNLQTCESIIKNIDRIDKQVLDKNAMPPGAWPRLTSEEKLIIQRWIDDGAPAPCD